jgi:hypothetical protein
LSDSAAQDSSVNRAAVRMVWNFIDDLLRARARSVA